MRRGKGAKPTPPAEAGAPAAPALVTRLELAKVLGCSPRLVEKLLEEGMPVRVRGRGGRASRYDADECRAWLEERNRAAATAPAEDGVLLPAQEKARREHWQALVAEQMYRKRAGELLDRAEVLKVWSAQCQAIRSRLLAWATTLADRVHRASTLDGLPGVEKVLHEATREVLTELAAGGAGEDDGEEVPKPKRRKRERIA